MATIDSDALKQATIEQWTADPCGHNLAESEPGTQRYFETLRAARDDYAPWLESAFGYSETAGLDVLDVGSGQGLDLVRYANAGARVTGIDLTPRHNELARLHLASLELPGEVVEGDAESLPFESESFDRVSSNGVLHHTPDIDAALREIHRVLKPGGEVRFTVYNRRSFHYWLTQVLWQGILTGGLLRHRSMAGVLSAGVEYSRVGARPLVRVYSPADVRQLLRDAGFESVSTSVRHFQLEDTPVTYPLRRLRRLRDPALLDRIGRIGGWYVVGRGVRGQGART